MEPPQLWCSQCKTRLTIDDHHWQDGFGSADATCSQCGGQWRYIRTPATGWNRAVDLRAYYANQKKRGINEQTN